MRGAALGVCNTTSSLGMPRASSWKPGRDKWSSSRIASVSWQLSNGNDTLAVKRHTDYKPRL